MAAFEVNDEQEQINTKALNYIKREYPTWYKDILVMPRTYQVFFESLKIQVRCFSPIEKINILAGILQYYFKDDLLNLIPIYILSRDKKDEATNKTSRRKPNK